MAERKSLGKKIRFEVFKRDKFTCQYCGRMSPDVILEVDHIEPVSKGGSNDLINLITSCRDCNRGKGKTRISDDSKVKKQQDQIKELAEKNEQVKMMIEWQKGLHELEDMEVSAIDELITNLTGFGLDHKGRFLIQKQLTAFSFQEVYEATKISFDRYYDYQCDDTFDHAVQKIGGVCYNRRKQRGSE